MTDVNLPQYPHEYKCGYDNCDFWAGSDSIKDLTEMRDRHLKIDHGHERVDEAYKTIVTFDDERDRNARAYGWEVGKGKIMRFVMDCSEGNPFMDPEWRDQIQETKEGVMTTRVHDHADGLFCDDCPDALRQNLKRLLVLHQRVRLPDPTADCTCGWVMPFQETNQHEAHQADVISAELARLGWASRQKTGSNSRPKGN